MTGNTKQYSLMVFLPLVCICAISFCLGGCSSVRRARQAETIHLFNGKDLDSFCTLRFSDKELAHNAAFNVGIAYAINMNGPKVETNLNN